MSIPDPPIPIDVARAFKPLLGPARYKGAYGGRGGAKSHFFAEILVLRCYEALRRAVCIREVQLSIKDSVRQLLIDKIEKLELGGFFEVLDTEIRGQNGSLIIFKGMQNYNAENIKSLEGFDVAWVEEAQTLSAHSLELLRPTIRKEGSELWFSWNPRHRTDPVDQLFRQTPPPDAISVNVNWRDNPWFPEVLKREMNHDFATDEDTAEHIWEGAYGVQRGAILSRWVNRAEREGRIHNGVVFDPDGLPIEISSDIGFRDTASWWFWQRMPGGYSLLDYDGESGLDASEWIDRLQEHLDERGWPLGKIWLPHDAKAKTFQSRHSAAEQFLEAFSTKRCGIVPVSSKSDRINAARTVIRKCVFHKTDCADGLDGLRAWEYEWNQDIQAFSKEPKHDWASHPSDAFSYGCQILQEAPPPPPPDPPMTDIESVTMDRLWKDQQKRRGRVRI